MDQDIYGFYSLIAQNAQRLYIFVVFSCMTQAELMPFVF